MKLFVFLIFLFPLSTLSKERPQEERFIYWMDEIAKQFNSLDAEDVAKNLIEGKSRVTAYNLQALAKIYSQALEDKKGQQFFSKLRNEFKDLEDALGEYKKWNELGKRREREEAFDELADELENNWILKENGEKNEQFLIYKRMEQIRNWNHWPSANEDKKTVVQFIKNQVEKIEKTNYDLTRLEKDRKGEDRNGLHELRRELKWLIIQQRVLGGMIQFSPDSFCPVREFGDLKPGGKYGGLPDLIHVDHEVCYIPKCLFLGVVEAVDFYGDMKDKIEEDDEAREKDKVPDEFVDVAQDYYKKLVKAGTFREYKKALNKCLD